MCCASPHLWHLACCKGGAHPLQEPLPFEGQSSYAADYPPKQGEAAVPGGMAAPPRTALPFEGSSRYQEDFGPKQGERYEHPTVPVTVPRLPFEGQSSYSADYVPKQAEGPAGAVQLAGRRVCLRDIPPVTGHCPSRFPFCF